MKTSVSDRSNLRNSFPVNLRECRPQRFMPFYHPIQCPAKSYAVEIAPQAEVERDVMSPAAAFYLRQKPQSMLGKGQSKPPSSFPARRGRKFSGNCIRNAPLGTHWHFGQDAIHHDHRNSLHAVADEYTLRLSRETELEARARIYLGPHSSKNRSPFQFRSTRDQRCFRRVVQDFGNRSRCYLQPLRLSNSAASRS